MDSLINSISAVKNAYNVYLAGIMNNGQTSINHQINALHTIGVLIPAGGLDHHINLKQNEEYIKGICNVAKPSFERFIENYIFTHEELRRTDEHDETSLLQLINRDKDENLFSDLIAAIFDPRITGEFAYQLYHALMRNYENEKDIDADLNFLNTYRERRLDCMP